MKFKFKKSKSTSDSPAEVDNDVVVSDEFGEKSEKEEKLGTIKQQVRTFVISYKLAVIGFVIMLVLLFIGGLITSGSRSVISAKQAEIYACDIDYQYYMQLPKVTLKASKPYTLDPNRWKKDDVYVLALIRDAFEHDSVSDYEEHRKKYADLSVNLTDLQKEYFSGVQGPVYYGNITADNYLGDASELVHSIITKFNSYVESVDGDRYNYVAEITISQDVYAKEHISATTKNIILTYSCENPVNTDIDHSVDVVDMTVDWLY